MIDLGTGKPDSPTRQPRMLLWAASILGTLSAIAIGLGIWLRLQQSELPKATSPEQATALLNYNWISHGLWLAIVVALLLGLWREQRTEASSRDANKVLAASPRESTNLGLKLWQQI